MMDRNYIDLHLVTDRYMRGTLGDAEKAEFEERLVWDRELVDELDLAERLRDGLRESVSDDSYTINTNSPSIVGRLSDVLAVPQYAAAASFLFAVTLTVTVLLSPVMPDSDDPIFDATPLPTEIIPLLVLRGTNVQTVALHNDATMVLLVDAVGAYDSYRVTIRKDEPDAEPVWRQERLLPTYPDSLAVGMPGDFLSAGLYVLTVEGMQVSEAGVEYFEYINEIFFDATLEE